MKKKKIVNVLIVMIFLCLIIGIGIFQYNATRAYTIDNNFESVPLQFDPVDSSSIYKNNQMELTVYGGFVKGIEINKEGTKVLIIRALSPLPSVNIEGSGTIVFRVENINPDFYIQSIDTNNLTSEKESANTLEFSMQLTEGQINTIEPVVSTDSLTPYQYVILGDNRDGYDTFKQIINQINGIEPVFVIDNGDLVYSGKPNQYRLFDKITGNISATLCTTLGNHDIRGDGRSIYTTLYGPPYYSFDFGESHFIFLDSSPGWAKLQAISDEQYSWLENDLIKAQGKEIFVISHIPPHDPRTETTENQIANYVDEIANSGSWLERKLNDYSISKSMNHGFQDAAEAEKFENLMSEYHVDTVYLSHIHSYLEYTKDGVRYLITGGAGAELLSTTSYYHYMIAPVDAGNTTTIVELPSPANSSISRFLATGVLFATAMYQENPIAVIFIIAGFVLFIILIVIKLYFWKSGLFKIIGIWFRDIAKYSVRHFRNLLKKDI